MSNGSLNLVANSKVIWRSMISLYVSEAVLLDTGNFVLRYASGVLWQSFDNPTDTWLPGAMVGINAKLISWRNEGDPAIGNYSLEMEPNGGGELYIKQIGGKTLWRSEIWPSFSPVGSLYSFSFVDRAFLTYKVKNESAVVRVVLSYSGVIIRFLWQESSQAWVHLAFQPADSCKVFARCGPNAVCDIRYSPSCKCLDGFVPQVKDDFSRGCTRMKPLQCDEDKTEFMELTNIRFPAYAQTLEIAMKGVCEFVCRGNCSCTAYANSNGGGCLLFRGDLIDSESMPDDSGITLYVRMSCDTPLMKGKKKL